MKMIKHKLNLKLLFASAVIVAAISLLEPTNVNAQWTTPDANQNIKNTNSGNVGIGTATPSGLLHIFNTSNTYTSPRLLVDGSFNNPAASSNDVYFRANLDNNAGHTLLRLEHNNVAGGTPNGFLLKAVADGGASAFDAFTLNAAGIAYFGSNVGLGTTTPTSKLHLRSGTDSATTIFHLDTGVHGGTAFAISGTANNESGFDLSVFRTGQYFSRFGVSTAGNVYLQPGSGTVGIGTSTPNTGYKLDVQGGLINASGGLCMAGDCKTSWSQVTGGAGSSQWTTTAGSSIYYNTGNVGVGTTTPSSKLHVVGDGTFTGNLTVSGNLAAKYQDVAEWVDSSQELVAGTVVILDPSKSNQVIASTQSYDSRVAGVISLRPGLALGERGEGRVLVATTGRVKVKVDATNGPIQIGDLLVTSGREGFAMKSVPVEFAGVRIHRPGTLIGKALEPLAVGSGEILVLLSLQ